MNTGTNTGTNTAEGRRFPYTTNPWIPFSYKNTFNGSALAVLVLVLFNGKLRVKILQGAATTNHVIVMIARVRAGAAVGVEIAAHAGCNAHFFTLQGVKFALLNHSSFCADKARVGNDDGFGIVEAALAVSNVCPLVRDVVTKRDREPKAVNRDLQIGIGAAAFGQQLRAIGILREEIIG